jgi:UDPglucose 6-dehydrogenase
MNLDGRHRIGIFGAGYVGIVTAAGLAELGRSTVLYDTDAAKIALLRRGGLPIYEAGLPELVANGRGRMPRGVHRRRHAGRARRCRSDRRAPRRAHGDRQQVDRSG